MPRVAAPDLTAFALALLVSGGLDPDLALTTAEVLVEGDMIGHDTHGVGLLPWYLDELAAGHMARSGDPAVVSDRGAAFVWDGRRLPGAVLLTRAMDLACDRAAALGVVTAAIHSAHHTCALAVFLRQRLSRHIRFRADYGLYDYTAYVYREPR